MHAVIQEPPDGVVGSRNCRCHPFAVCTIDVTVCFKLLDCHCFRLGLLGLSRTADTLLTKKDASKEEFGRRALAGGNMWDSLSCLLTLLESFDKNNPEMGIDSVARQMHQKTVQHY